MTMQTIVSQPITKITTDYLTIPPATSQQVLKYIVDFTNITLSAGSPFINRITFQPGGVQNFGTAKSVRIDTRWMTAPLILSISDSLNDYVVVPPGCVRFYNVPSSGSDTYTVTLSMINNGSPGSTYNFGYAKLFFYNFLGVEWPKPLKPVIQTKTVAIPVGGGSIGLSVGDSANFSGIPILDWVRIAVTYGLAGAGPYSITMFPNPVAPMYYDNPNPILYNSFMIIDNSAGGTQTQTLNDMIELNIQFPVNGTPITPKDEGLLTGAQYTYGMEWNMLFGSAITGGAQVTAGYHFPE